MSNRVRAAQVGGDPDVIAKYLPNNYSIVFTESYTDPKEFLIVGVDVAGWTLDGYVIPRLASGLHFAEEVSTEDIRAVAP